MLHTIQNDFLAVTASEMGAELQSVRTMDGTEYLWQGDEKYWGNRATNIFPYVARLWQGCYEMDGQVHHMAIHGFASRCRFSLCEKTQERMAFELCDSEETQAQYPRKFVFRILYALRQNALDITYEVVNRDEKAMYFGVGGHPGFNVPLEAGKTFEDYQLRFAQPCTPLRTAFSEDCFVIGQGSAYPLEEGTILPLRHDLFDEDAIVLRDMAREVTLCAPGAARSVTVSFPDMAYLGVWHRPKTDAPYVCIEPWTSLPAKRGEIAVFEKQDNLICLKAGAVYRNTWTVSIR